MISSLTMLHVWRANQLRGEVHIARGVEAGLQDASDTSAVVTTSIVNRGSRRRKHEDFPKGISVMRSDYPS
jgi:hypothetical protein